MLLYRIQYLIGMLNNKWLHFYTKYNISVMYVWFLYRVSNVSNRVYFWSLKIKTTKHSTIFLDQILMQIFYFSYQIGVTRAFFYILGKFYEILSQIM